MESNRTYHLIFKYGLLGIGLLIISVPLMAYIFPNAVEINGETGALSLISSIVFGVILIVLFFSINDKFAVVEIGNQTITIKQNGKVKTFQWTEVESVSQFQFVFPPLYKLTTKDNEKTVWFNTEPNYISIGGYTIDDSDMGNLIKKKKRELSI